MRVVKAAAICVVLASVWGQRAEGFCPEQFGATGQVFWTAEVVKYKVSDNAPAEVQAAIDQAFIAWASAPCSTLRFENTGTFELGSIPFTNPGSEAQIYFFWYDAANKDSFPTDHAILFYPYRGHDGISALSFSSIALNAFYTNAPGGYSYEWATDGSANKFDVQTIVLRVIGQSIGLTTSTDADSVMQRELAAGDTTGHTLGADDIAALQYLYPAAGGDNCPAEPPKPDPSCSTTGDSTDPGNAGGGNTRGGNTGGNGAGPGGPSAGGNSDGTSSGAANAGGNTSGEKGQSTNGNGSGTDASDANAADEESTTPSTGGCTLAGTRERPAPTALLALLVLFARGVRRKLAL